MKTPPLTWVRAFCEAGRQGSFKQAATALNLAPSTVSHEIRKLEDWLGQTLFDRGPPTARLTAEGRKLYALVEPAFDQLDAAFVQFAQAKTTTLRVGMLPFLASELVLPNLEHFSSMLGTQGIQISSSIHLADLSHSEASQRVDAVVRYAKQAPPGYASAPLTQVALAMVTGGSSTNPTPTNHGRRIKLSGSLDGWGELQAAGLPLPQETHAPIVVDNYLSAMRAVEQGVGIGIAVLPLCEPWLSQDRIHLANRKLCELEDRYWLVWRNASPNHDLLLALARHLQQQFELASQRIATLTA